MKPIFLKIGLFLLSGIVFFCGCQTTTKDDPESLEERAAVSLPFMTVSKKELTNTISIPGHVSALPDHSVVVTPHIIGKIKRMSVVPGQRVEKGQIIAELDDRQIQVQLRQAISPELAAEAAVAQAEAEHAFAGKELERLKDLFEGDLAAKKDVVLQETNLKTAAAKLAAAKAKLEEARSASDDEETLLGFTKIRSPISGVVAERFLNIGDEATPNKPIVHLVDLHEVVIDADMPADIPLNVNLGHRATVRSVANPKIEYEGIVISISPLVHNQSNTVKVRLKCLNRDGGLREGQTVSVS
ncbi:MAG: efflux RND transporter periplasmic adaptor subunit, partial [Candidatus Obscuribacterales bacterium]|nr:efflux RND transporter periplasmic adaptor subunit [Candidatus Obscuribacterales bacterium]